LPPTREQRDKFPLCSAKKKASRGGGTCRLFAGQGTDHPGVGLCRWHGGNSPNGKKHAATIEAKRAMVKLGVPIEEVTAPAALMGLLRATSGHVAWLHAQVGDIEDLSDHEAQVVVRLYDTERDRLVRIGEACIRAGVAEAEVRVMEAQVGVLGQALKKACGKAGFSADQQRRLGAALRDELAKSESHGARNGRDDAGSIFVTA
jgi:hypothetical protein